MTTRREFLTVTLAGGAAAALAPGLAAAAAPKSMSVVHESSFIKAFDDFFVKTLSPEYEKLTGIKVGYEAVSVGSMLTRLTTIVETKAGPELVHTGINWPHLFDQGLLDVTDVAGEVGKKIGPWHDNILDSVVVNKKWKAVPWGNIGQLEVYRTDWFKEVGVTKFPDTWEDLLAAGRDIRELMAARNLHIVDVFDTDPRGKTRPAFGRIFFTEGKSLLFYAYDMPDTRLKDAGYHYRIWGKKEGPNQQARNLGIFFSDDKSKKRWVFQYDDPKVLNEIDSVFVTLEPPNGNPSQPKGDKLLYAYLKGQANHP